MKYLLLGIISFFLIALDMHAQQQDTLMRGVYLSDFDTVNYHHLYDSLHVNAVELRTGLFGSAWEDSAMYSEPRMRVINQRQFLRNMSTAQRMVYEAEVGESANLLWNYFAEVHPEREIITEEDTIALRLTPGLNTGYMVRSAVPNNEYHYSQWIWNYLATFRLKIEGTSLDPGTEVVRCIVIDSTSENVVGDSITLYVGDFTPGTYKDTSIAFTFSPHPLTPQSSPPQPVLTGGAVSAAPYTNHFVDVRVYWYGNVTTYLDKIIVQDEGAHAMFDLHWYDDSLKIHAAQVGNTATHHRFYLEDEPPMSTFLAFNYVGNRIKDTLGHGNLKAKSIAATYKNFERFLADATPGALMVDPYFLFSDIPHPSITNTDSANAWGIEPWNEDTYVHSLQARIDEYLQSSYRPAAEAASRDTLIFIPQLHGIAFHSGGSTKYRCPTGIGLRPPSPSEMRLQYNLALAYGGKGFVGYPFGTDYLPNGFDIYNYPTAMVGLVSNRMSNGYRMDHYNNVDTVYGSSVWTGYKEKWDAVAELNKRIASIGDTLLALKWIGTRSWNTETNSGTWSSPVLTACTTKDTLGSSDPTTYVETGHLQRGTTDYIVVVNRRCANEDSRDISPTLKSSTSDWLLTDIETNRSWVVKQGCSFTDRFRPGEGKIYRLQSATVAGTRTFPQLKFTSGGTLTLASNANITARGNMDTVNIRLGTNAIFKADTNSSMVVATDTSLVFGSGSELKLYGSLYAKNGVTVSIPTGGTFHPFAGSQCRFGTDAVLSITGTLDAEGAIGNPITLTGISSGLWGGIIDNNGVSGSTISLDHVNLLNVDGTAVQVFSNCNFVMLDCTVDVATTGVEITPGESATYPNIQLTNNTFTDCPTGIFLYNSSNVNINDSKLYGNDNDGIVLVGSSPVMLRNIITGWKSGLSCHINSSPMLESYQDGGNNVIKENTSTGVYIEDGSEPDLGTITDEEDVGGQNSIFANAEYDVTISSSGIFVSADSNWWGSTNNPPGNFNIDGGSELHFDPFLLEDPNPTNSPLRGSFAAKVASWSDTGPRNSMETLPELMQLAMKERKRGNFNEAISLYKEIVESSEMPLFAKRWALGQLLAVAQRIRNPRLAEYLVSLNHPELAQRIKSLLPFSLWSEGSASQAMSAFSANIQQYPNSNLAKAGLYGKFVHSLYSENDTSLSRSLLYQLQASYPRSNEARFAQTQLRIRRRQSNGSTGSLNKAETPMQSLVQKPKEFALHQNYPNPFNPTTTMKYDLPNDEHAILKVYDVLGREVLTLVDEQKKSGYHSTTRLDSFHKPRS